MSDWKLLARTPMFWLGLVSLHFFPYRAVAGNVKVVDLFLTYRGKYKQQYDYIQYIQYTVTGLLIFYK